MSVNAPTFPFSKHAVLSEVAQIVYAPATGPRSITAIHCSDNFFLEADLCTELRAEDACHVCSVHDRAPLFSVTASVLGDWFF